MEQMHIVKWTFNLYLPKKEAVPGRTSSMKYRYFSEIARNSSHNSATILRFSDPPLS